MKELTIAGRKIGKGHPPLVVAEIGINHEGSVEKARQMIEDAADAGCECVKLQTHIPAEEMIPNDIVPSNAKESLWQLMQRCALSADEEKDLKEYAERKGLLFLSTPFSRAGVDRLETLGVSAYKIGSGECNNLPLVEYVARRGKPVLLSTGMNDLRTIAPAVEILRRYRLPFALLHCTSLYPTPYERIRLGALTELERAFPDAVLGLSDHSLSNYPCLAAVALGACIVERHFTSDKRWPGPDIPISMDKTELRELIQATRIIHQALGGTKAILPEEASTIRFAYASVVSTRPISKGEPLTEENIWVKRPGTGEVPAAQYFSLLGRKVNRSLSPNEQLRWEWLE